MPIGVICDRCKHRDDCPKTAIAIQNCLLKEILKQGLDC